MPVFGTSAAAVRQRLDEAWSENLFFSQHKEQVSNSHPSSINTALTSLPEMCHRLEQDPHHKFSYVKKNQTLRELIEKDGMGRKISTSLSSGFLAKFETFSRMKGSF